MSYVNSGLHALLGPLCNPLHETPKNNYLVLVLTLSGKNYFGLENFTLKSKNIYSEEVN